MKGYKYVHNGMSIVRLMFIVFKLVYAMNIIFLNILHVVIKIRSNKKAFHCFYLRLSLAPSLMKTAFIIVIVYISTFDRESRQLWSGRFLSFFFFFFPFIHKTVNINY